jgi:hypothetical protein
MSDRAVVRFDGRREYFAAWRGRLPVYGGKGKSPTASRLLRTEQVDPGRPGLLVVGRWFGRR